MTQNPGDPRTRDATAPGLPGSEDRVGRARVAAEIIAPLSARIEAERRLPEDHGPVTTRAISMKIASNASSMTN